MKIKLKYLILAGLIVAGGVSAYATTSQCNPLSSQTSLHADERQIFTLCENEPLIQSVSATVRTWRGYGVTVKDNNGWVTLDGKPAAVDEKTAKATVYQSGLYKFIIYKSGKVALLKEGVFVGYLK